MLTDEQVETYLRCRIGETSQRCKKCMNFEQWDDDMQCEFGPEQAKALLSDRAELVEKTEWLEATLTATREQLAERKPTVHPAVGLRFCGEEKFKFGAGGLVYEVLADGVLVTGNDLAGTEMQRVFDHGREYERRQG